MQWNEAQIGFAEGRSKQLPEELKGLSENAKKNVIALFGKFKTSINEATRIAEEREKMNFENLLIDMGYMTTAERPAPRV